MKVWTRRLALLGISCTLLLAATPGAAMLAPSLVASRAITLHATGRGILAPARIVNLRKAAEAGSAPGQHPALVLPFLTVHSSPSAVSHPRAAVPTQLTPIGGVAQPLSAAPQTATAARPGVLASFPAASYSADTALFGSDQPPEPPDTQIAAGGSDLVEPVNDTLWVWSKTGTPLVHADLRVFFPVPSGYEFGDPRVAFDPLTDRWFMSGLAFDRSNSNSIVYLAASETSDPLGTWYFYTVSSKTGIIQDQPKVGFDSNVVALSWNDYLGATFTGQETWILNKSEVLAGGPVAPSSFGPDATRFDVVPAISLSTASTEYAAYNSSCGASTTGTCPTGAPAIGVVSLTGIPPNIVTWTESDPAIVATINPPAADQPGAAASVVTNDDRFLADTFDNGTLYVSGNDGCVPSGDSTERSCARLIEVATATTSVTVDGDLSYSGASLYYPAVVPDSKGNVLLAATYSSTVVYPEAVGLAIASGASSFSGTAFRSGAGVYSGNRWGDYSGAALDPTDPNHVWLAAEYAPVSGGDWGTAIGELTLAAPSVTGVRPNSGPTGGGTAVTVSGSNFASSDTVDFGATAATSATVVSPAQIDAVSPPGSAGTIDVTVATPAGTSATSSADQFAYVVPALAVTTTTLPTGRIGRAYSATLAASGGTTPYTWSISSGALPTGLTLAASTGVISGTPTGTAGTTSFTVMVDDSSSPVQSVTQALSITLAPPGGAYTALPPTRLLDSRSTGQTLGPGASLNLTVTGGSVPANATAVALNVTVTNTTAGSYLSVYPTGGSRPLLSNLNWGAGETVPNLVMVPVGTNGEVTFYNDLGNTDVVVDLEGYFAPEASGSTAGSYVPLSPARITDTRAGSGEPNSGLTLGAGGTLNVQVTGVGGVPSTGVRGVVMNVTVADTTAASYLTVYPQGGVCPLASNLNWTAGEIIANRVVVPVNSSNGQITIYNQLGSTDVVIDVNGYFTTGVTIPANESLFTPITPVRVLDTRSTGQILGAGAILTEQMGGVDGIAATATAVVTNVTAVDTTAASYFTVYPGGARPTASDVNWGAGQIVPNLTLASLSNGGGVYIYNNSGSANVIVDAFGYFSPD